MRYPTAEFIIDRPCRENNWRWSWTVFVPDVPGQPALMEGYSNSMKEAAEYARRALASVGGAAKEPI